MITESAPQLRWVKRGDKFVLQYRVEILAVDNATDEEIEKYPRWRDVEIKEEKSS